MKKISIYTILLLTLTLFFSCNEENYEAPYGDYTSFNWFTTSGSDETDYVSPINDFIGFYDLSSSAITREWSIPEGTNFLSTDFAETSGDYSDYILAAGPNATSEERINVIFREPGIKEILLKSTFKDSVTDGVLIDGIWKVEKKFTVDVFADVNPAFKILKGTQELYSITEADMPNEDDSNSWPTITLEAGEELTFVDETTEGRPDSRTWTFSGGNIETSNAASTTVAYFGLGTFKGGNITVKRKEVKGEKPAGETIKFIPVNIEVIPSSQPFVQVGEINENESQIISLNVSGQVGTLIGEEANFTVSVTNSTSGFNQNITVNKASINSTDSTKIDLELSAPIYNSDVITVSYTKDNIVSVDTRVLESFGPINVNMHFEGAMNVDGFSGYEVEWNGGGNQFKKANMEGYWGQHNANNENGPLYYWRDDSFKKEGNSSLKFETPATGIPALARLQGSKFAALSPVPAGTYKPAVWVYLEDGNTMSTIQYNFLTKAIPLNFDVSSTPRGKWVRLTLPSIDVPALNAGRLDINITNAGQADAIVQKLWLDSFDMLIVEPRS